MLHVIVAASDPSKVPFYILGGLFAVWAVVLAYIGLRNPKFPGGLAGQRGVIAVSLVIAVATMGIGVYVK